MTSRERVLAAINHKKPDYTPFDLGGCGQTGINASTLWRLRKAYGLPDHPVKICEPFQMLGEVEFDLLNKVGADVIPLWNPGNLMGLSSRITKAWTLGDGTPVLMPDNFEYDIDKKGDTLVFPQGDRGAPYSLHMPAGGTFFDNIYRSPPVDEDNLTPVEDYKDNYTIASDEDCRYWEHESKRLYEETGFAIMGVKGGMGLGDVAEIPGPFLTNPKGIRDIESWLMAHIIYPDYVKAVFEYETDIALKNLEMYRQAVGDRIQVIWLSGTDFGTQCGLMQSKETFTSLYKPYYKRVNDWVHKNTSWKIFFHTCGAIESLIPELIDCGVDILNPVQISASGMDSALLKKTYGDKIVFWGGGIDTQTILPRGTPEEVRSQALEQLAIFSPDGGFVFAAVHNIVAHVPVENIIAMFEAVREFRGGGK
ncbi:methyltransferase [Spirochaetia bacterium]|nr:methyltransferase [Spirochaetia bacterium]